MTATLHPKSTWTRALVTGASSGIGLAMAQQLAERSTHLVVVARDQERLDALAVDVMTAHDVQVEVLVADLADPADLDRVAARVSAVERPIDLLVNNAGIGFDGPFADLDYAGEATVVAVNVVALHRLCHAAAQAMRDRGGGTVLNVSSVAAELVGPGSATYNATKAFVNSFSQSLAVDLADSGVVVSCLMPGMTRTEFQERAGSDINDVPDWIWQTAEQVAEAGLVGAEAGKAIVVSGKRNRVLRSVNASLPGPVRRAVTAAVSRARE
ncbi:MAG: SDR family oxidoreductase [Acidimicrobiales bacterium]|nr:SDR family oxidoreductase [Acidimicrobiales bacterium]